MIPKTIKTPALILTAVAIQCAALSAQAPIGGIDDLAELEASVLKVSQQVLPATVALVSESIGSSGSGVIISADGLILTAAHVIQGAEEISVVFPDGEQVQGKVLGANYSKDIGMVRIIDEGKWPFVNLGKSRNLDAGEWVIALGHSTGYDAARTPPVRFGRIVSKGPGNFLTSDCTLIGGDSGGPLFDLDGNLVGIHSSIGNSLSNNNHAGIDGFREDWDRMLQGEAWGELQMNPLANPDMPVIGIGPSPSRGLAGVLIGSVAPNSPAAKTGLRIGDRIVGIDGAKVRNFQELTVMVAKKNAGERIQLQVTNERGNRELDLTLARRGDLFAN
ncbi:MAG: serine protease [Verrucomicrobia bacterium]|nr:MAG: serine protease [Verrucomicrobiota bacterium]